MTPVTPSRAAVYAGRRPVAWLLWSGRCLKVEDTRGRALGRLLPAGYLEGRPDDGSGLYDVWTAKHPLVHTPSDQVVARDRTVEEAVALLVEGALSGTRLPVLLRQLRLA